VEGDKRGWEIRWAGAGLRRHASEWELGSICEPVVFFFFWLVDCEGVWIGLVFYFFF